MLIFVVNIRPARTFWNSTHCLLSPFTLNWSRNLLRNPMWNMTVNNMSYSIYLLSTKIEKVYITKIIPFFFFVYVLQLVRFVRCCISVLDFRSKNVLISSNLSKQCYKISKGSENTIITDSVVLWKIQKFDWLIPETKWHSCLHNRALC